MATNLFTKPWSELDPTELGILLNERIGMPGQYERLSKNVSKLHLPLHGPTCKIHLSFRGKTVMAIEPGPAFDAGQWKALSDEVAGPILNGAIKVGREFSFCSHRVKGFWRGKSSGVQFLPPPSEAPVAPVEIAEHPFILEFPLSETSLSRLTNHRRLKTHRRLTLLLNVLLGARVNVATRQQESFWGAYQNEDGKFDIRWVNNFFFAKLGKVILDQLTAPNCEPIAEVAPEEYYKFLGHDGEAIRIPSDLDESICRYQAMSNTQQNQFDRAMFWVDNASRQWSIAASSSFASLVSAVEALTERGKVHKFKCPICEGETQHEVPGATEKFREFIETFAPGEAQKERRSEMYAMRSVILHGSGLMQLDDERAFMVEASWWNEYDLFNELWKLTRVILRNWMQRVVLTS